MKKNWLSGMWLLFAMLACSVSFAVATPTVLPVAAFDALAVADAQPTSLVISADAQIKPVNDSIANIANIGAGSAGLFRLAMATDSGGDNNTVPCMATCNHKTTNNVTAYMAKSYEVGWR